MVPAWSGIPGRGQGMQKSGGFKDGGEAAAKVRIVLGTGDGRMSNPRVSLITEGEARILFTRDDPPGLAVGAELAVTIELVDEGSCLNRRVRFTDREDSGQWCAYDLIFLQTKEERQTLARLIERLFNKRQAYRVIPGYENMIKVELSAPGAKGKLEGTVLNISATGAAAFTTTVADELIASVSVVDVALRLPGLMKSVTICAQIVGRHLQAGGVVYRMAFLEGSSSDSERNMQTVVEYVMDLQRVKLRQDKSP